MTPPENIADNGAITARGPVAGVTIHSHMRSGPHAIMEFPLDLALITEVMYLLAEQARQSTEAPPLLITPQALIGYLQARGVRSANGKPIGRDAVYESFARLRGKGYFDRITERKDDRVAGVRYDFYEFPAWNPNPVPLPGDSTSSQVGATSGIAGSGIAGSRSKNRTSRSSSQVGATSGIAGSGIAGSSPRNGTSSQVGATSGIAGSPPHPPEGVVSTSPYPLTDGARPHPPQTEEGGACFATDEIEAAVDFMLDFDKPWMIGDATARKHAPLLLAAMRNMEWPGIKVVDKALLRKHLQTDPPEKFRAASIVALRIRDLPRYSKVVATVQRDAQPRSRYVGTGL